MSKWQQHLCSSSEKLQSKRFPEGTASQPVPDNAHCSQAQATKSIRPVLAESELLCDRSLLFSCSFCAFHFSMQIPAPALACEDQFLQNLFHLCPFPRPPDLVFSPLLLYEQEPPLFSRDSFCHCLPALQTSLVSAGCAIPW